MKKTAKKKPVKNKPAKSVKTNGKKSAVKPTKKSPKPKVPAVKAKAVPRVLPVKSIKVLKALKKVTEKTVEIKDELKLVKLKFELHQIADGSSKVRESKAPGYGYRLGIVPVGSQREKAMTQVVRTGAIKTGMAVHLQMKHNAEIFEYKIYRENVPNSSEFVQIGSTVSGKYADRFQELPAKSVEE